MKNKWLRMAIWTLCCLLPSTAIASQFDNEILFVASQYLYVREKTNRNDAPEIDQWLKFCGLDNQKKIKKTKKGYPYCAAYGCFIISETYKAHNLPTPFFKSAGCADILNNAKRDKYTYRVIKPKDVFIGAVILKPSDIVIWSSNKNSEYNWNGHFGLVVSQINNNEFKSIEGNTVGSNADADQREQSKGSKNVGGVYYKKRKIGLGTTEFPVEGFIRIID
jgi:hypothetical protein